MAARPISDFETYRERLSRFVFRSGFIMKPVFAQAKAAAKRIIYAEGEDERILRAVQVVVEEGLARPILVGRPAVVEARLARFGLSLRMERDAAPSRCPEQAVRARCCPHPNGFRDSRRFPARPVRRCPMRRRPLTIWPRTFSVSVRHSPTFRRCAIPNGKSVRKPTSASCSLRRYARLRTI